MYLYLVNYFDILEKIELKMGIFSQVPAEIMAALEPIKDNEEAVRAYGIHLGTEMCKKILAHDVKTLHLYSLNLEKSVLGILQVNSKPLYYANQQYDSKIL